MTLKCRSCGFILQLPASRVRSPALISCPRCDADIRAKPKKKKKAKKESLQCFTE